MQHYLANNYEKGDLIIVNNCYITDNCYKECMCKLSTRSLNGNKEKL